MHFLLDEFFSKICKTKLCYWSVYVIVSSLKFVIVIFVSRKGLKIIKKFWLYLRMFYPVNVFYFADWVAIRAIELKNHSSLNGKVIRVMWLSRDADARKSGKGNVFVKVYVIHYYTILLWCEMLKWWYSDSFLCMKWILMKTFWCQYTELSSIHR